MDHRKRRAVFAVDGYEISATFADSRNTAVLGHVKQILLSSFANNLTDKTPGDSLALKAKLSDNNSGDTPMHLATKISRSVNLDKQVFNASSMKDPQHK